MLYTNSMSSNNNSDYESQTTNEWVSSIFNVNGSCTSRVSNIFLYIILLFLFFIYCFRFQQLISIFDLTHERSITTLQENHFDHGPKIYMKKIFDVVTDISIYRYIKIFKLMNNQVYIGYISVLFYSWKYIPSLFEYFDESYKICGPIISVN